MAEALTHALAAQNHLSVRAESAGTLGGGEINPLAIQAMEEIGISMAAHYPKQLTQEMIERSTRIISMGCGVDADACPAKFLATEDWGLDDPAGQPIEKVRLIRDEIRTRVKKLLEDLKS